MTPEIRRYLDEHGATYTPDALRQGLIAAGHDPAEVDVALREWRDLTPTVDARSDFRRWSLWLHVAALIAMAALVVLLNGISAAGIIPVAAVVLGIVLLVGWVISGFVGRWLLPRTGLLVALIAPAVSALLIGGTCVALLDSLTPDPGRPGTMEITVDDPIGASASGAAVCFPQDSGGVSVTGERLTSGDARVIFVSFTSFGNANEQGGPTHSFTIGLNPQGETEPSTSYSTSDSSRLTVVLSSNGLVGSVTFEGIPADAEAAPGEPAPTAGTISGTVEWTCE